MRGVIYTYTDKVLKRRLRHSRVFGGLSSDSEIVEYLNKEVPTIKGDHAIVRDMTAEEMDEYMDGAASAAADVEREEANGLAMKSLPEGWSIEDGIVINQLGEEV